MQRVCAKAASVVLWPMWSVLYCVRAAAAATVAAVAVAVAVVFHKL